MFSDEEKIFLNLMFDQLELTFDLVEYVEFKGHYFDRNDLFELREKIMNLT